MQTTTNITVSTAAPLIAPLIQPKGALDSVHEQLQAGRIADALDELFDDLGGRREEKPHDWAAYTRACLSHPVCRLLHQDPFTYRAFAKPRGYAGDAVMMDYIYGLGEAREAARNATPLGRAIFQYMDTRPSAKAVRFRRRLIAGLIDQAAQRNPARVLAVAAGHLREVELSSAVQTGKIQEFVAFDQDEASLATVTRDYAYLGVRTIPSSVRQILSGKAKLGQFDFVYAAGLFDYLSGPVAAALTCRMFEMTRPGGLMLIPNFLTGVRDTGYMEAFMDWRLIYRSHSDMLGLAAVLPRSAVADCQVFDDSDDSITCLLVSKAS
jgi:extracellular factor (EF) 3-hydroxypalmitic acid methyl ester biosynthesis protein